jgi:hypothetical protein
LLYILVNTISKELVMTTPTTTNADIVISKGNALYQNYSFDPSSQAELAQMRTALQNMMSTINSLDIPIRVASATSYIGSPSVLYLLPSINS